MARDSMRLRFPSCTLIQSVMIWCHFDIQTCWSGFVSAVTLWLSMCLLLFELMAHVPSCRSSFAVYCVVITFTWIVDIVLGNTMSGNRLGILTSVPQFIRFSGVSTVSCVWHISVICCIVPLWPATTVCTYFRFCNFSFVPSVLLHMYFVLRMCWFVGSSLLLRIFGMLSLQNRLSNSKLHYEFTVLYFWLLSFAWDPSISFQSHFLLQLFCLLIPLWYSFVLVVIVIGFCLSEWYIRLNESWAGVRWHNYFN